jgi:Holliday junction resolvase RusA-like endonuclease
MMLATQKKYRIEWDEWLEVIVWFYTPLYIKNGNKKKQDLDNLFKALLDILVKNIEWFEDEKIKRLSAEKIDSKEKYVTVIIKECKNI